MIAFNVVRFRIKPGFEDQFVEHHRSLGELMPGMRQMALVKTGDASYCLVGEWNSMGHIAAARPQMIGILDGMRHMLEDLGMGLGVTDPVSGEAVVTQRAPAPARKKVKAKAKPKPAKKKAGKKKKKKK
ncbi:MAG TPA: antibiotic biosynthesis monooxygenase [Burkholderiales bacterium]|nr:antibiotic biosynthesis monooxygenase [Burkholderiales bacterium]